MRSQPWFTSEFLPKLAVNVSCTLLYLFLHRYQGTEEINIKKIAIIIRTINVHAFIEILGYFLIPLIGNWFSDNEVNFQNDNASRHKGI